MDIGDNLKVLTLVEFHCSAEQLLNIPLELFYEELGADGAFKVWWLYHLVMFLQCYLALPAALIWNAHNKFPEFRGLRARTFPGQENPRAVPFVPRRSTNDHDMLMLKNENLKVVSAEAMPANVLSSSQRNKMLQDIVELQDKVTPKMATPLPKTSSNWITVDIHAPQDKDTPSFTAID